MSQTTNKSQKIIPITVSHAQYDALHVLKANSGKARVTNKEFYLEVFMAGLRALTL